MVKYVATAVALKCFSLTPLTRKIYRRLGNRVGDNRRSSEQMPGYYADRVRRIIRLAHQHKIVADGDRVLELGTGWLHWEALTLRLFFEIKAVLFDVWDNRQLAGLKNYVRQLDAMLDESFGLPASDIARARSLIASVLQVENFEELYSLLGFEYLVESSGSLDSLADKSFQLVVSGGVLEHVHRAALPTLIKATRRVLRDGGWAVHSIDTADHLEHYDQTVSPKLYLGFSETTWNLLCANDVQYINRLQRGEWMTLFDTSGFEVVEEEARRVDIGRIKIAPRFAAMEQGDLECTVLRLALRAK